MFNALVLCQVFNIFNARKIEEKNIFKGIYRNKLFLVIIGTAIVLQVVIIELLKEFGNAERLNWGFWGASIGIAAFSWPIACVVKWLLPINNKPDRFLSNVVKDKDYHALNLFNGVNGIIRYLKTDARKGINGNHRDIIRRQKDFGCNRYHKLDNKSFFHVVMEEMKDPAVVMLIVCSSLSLGLNLKAKGQNHSWYNGGSILIALLLVVIVRSVCHVWAQRQIKRLEDMAKSVKLEIMRNSQKQRILISNIVVGDIVYLRKGNRVPADGLLLPFPGHALRLDESLLRVDNRRVRVTKDENPFLFYGTKVRSGSGKMVVTSVGENTKWAQIVGLPGFESHEWISIKRRLKRLSKFSGLVGLAAAMSTLLVLMSQYFTSHLKNGDGEKMFVNGRTRGDEIWKAMVGILFSAIAVASSAVLDGLSFAIAITFAYTIKRMENVGVLPRTFSTCETLASATTICLSIEGTELQTRGIRKAVRDCKVAGVSIRLITRNNASTAKSRALQCGIVDPGENLDVEHVMKGSDIRNCTDAERIGLVEKATVLAEASSLDRLLLVRCLRKKHHVVAFIGDGADYAQALESADVGIYIGLNGDEIAVGSSDMIVQHGDLVSLLAALKMGRGIYDDIEVFILFLFTANAVSLVTDFLSTNLADHPVTIDILAAVSVSEVPYAVAQLLWVKVIVGTLSVLALIAEKKRQDAMQKPLTRHGQPLISNEMCRNILIRASYEIAILLTLQFKGEAIFHLHNNVKDTLIFILYVLFRVFAIFTPSKSEGNFFSGIQRGKLYWGIVSAILIIQFVIVETLPRVTATKTLNFWQWVACIGIAFTSWPVGFLGSKYIPVPEEHYLSYLSKRKKHQE